VAFMPQGRRDHDPAGGPANIMAKLYVFVSLFNWNSLLGDSVLVHFPNRISRTTGAHHYAVRRAYFWCSVDDDLCSYKTKISSRKRTAICFYVMERMGQNQRRCICFARWQYQSDVRQCCAVLYCVCKRTLHLERYTCSVLSAILNRYC